MISAVALLTIAWVIDLRGLLALIVVGPLVGAALDAARRGWGIVGGMIGGLVSFCGFGVVIYARADLIRMPNAVDSLGPILSLTGLALAGLFVGAIVGVLHALFVDRP